jgi:predicted nuclease of predicted toxin-antitoxin system
MRILIDECLDWRLCRSLVGHECSSAQKRGWAGLKNGDLLRKAETEFDVFITGDRNLAFQQNASGYDLTIVVLHADSVQLPETRALMPKVLEALGNTQAGTIMNIYP